MAGEVVGVTLLPTSTTEPTTQAVAPSPSDTVVVVRTICLLILLVMSLAGNALVVLAVAQSPTRQHNPFNAFVLSMASYGLLECALTMSLATGFSIEKSWQFGDFFSGFNASFVQLQNVGVMLTIGAMSVDRYIAVTRLTTYHTHSSSHHANYAVLYTWIHAFIFALPLLFQNQMIGITCRPFIERCICALVEGTSKAYTILLLVFCYVLPFLVILIFLMLVTREAAHEKRRLKSINNAEYLSYCVQESLLLNEAKYSQFVAILFIGYLVLKAPYIVIDILTQFNVTYVYESVNIDGSIFYYQTVLSWMMFTFSALFPILTFKHYPDYWRRMKTYLTCGGTTTATASERVQSALNQRNLRHKQRRLRQRQRQMNGQSKRRNKKRSTSLTAAQVSEKAPSCVSSNIMSEKIAVNGATSGEILFRVPVLYAATDGLHLVASEKTLHGNLMDSSKRKNCAASSNNNNNLKDLKSSLDSDTLSSKIAQPSSDVIDDLRPSSVVDKRVDVLGSRDCLQVDEEEVVSYINSDFDADEDTESELNESVNSRTLIWPNKRCPSAKASSLASFPHPNPKPVWFSESQENVSRSPFVGTESMRHLPRSISRTETSGLVDGDGDELPHPHTPSPPPDDEDLIFSITPTQYHFDSDAKFSDDDIIERQNVSLKLPAIKNKHCTASSRNSHRNFREEPLLSTLAEEESSGIYNSGYGNPSAVYSRQNNDVSVLFKQSNHLVGNKVFPDISSSFPASHDNPFFGKPDGNLNSSSSRYDDSISPDPSMQPHNIRLLSNSYKALQVTPKSGIESPQRAFSAHRKTRKSHS